MPNQWAKEWKSPVIKFWEKVAKGTNDACWNWISHRNKGGYGYMTVRDKERKKTVRFSAHRFSWWLHNGAINGNLCVCHKCDNPSCVNPTHLFLGTNSDNIKDAMNKGRRRGPQPWQTNTCVLTVDDVREIRKLGKTVSRKYLAEKYGVSIWHISDIRTKDVWKNV